MCRRAELSGVLQSLIRARIMLQEKSRMQHDTKLKTTENVQAQAIARVEMLAPVQVNEEAEQMVSQFNHSLFHMRLKLASVMDLCGV